MTGAGTIRVHGRRTEVRVSTTDVLPSTRGAGPGIPYRYPRAAKEKKKDTFGTRS